MKKYILVLLTLLLLPIAVADLDVTINNYDPVPALAGEHVDVWFKIQNTGQYTDVENNVQLKVEPKDGLTLTQGEESIKTIGVLGVGSQTLKYRFKVSEDAVEGPNRVDVTLLQNNGGIKRELFIDVLNDQADIQIGDLTSTPRKIRPDLDDIKLEITLLNLGDADAKAVRAELTNLPEGVKTSSSFSDTSLVGDIGIDTSAAATFYLDVEETTEPKEYKGRVKLTYKTSSETNAQLKQVTLPFDLNIQPVPLYSIGKVEFEPEVIQAGMKNVQMKVTIKNVGQEEGESIRLKVFTKNEQPFGFEISSTFVAPRLDPGESAQASLTFDVDDEASLQDYLLDVEIKNIIEDETIVTEDKITIPVTQAKSSNSLSYVIVGLVLVGGYFGYRFWTKKKKKQNHKRLKEAKDHYGESYLNKLSERKKK